MLAPLEESRIGTNNQPVLTISTGVVQAPKALRQPVMEKVIAITTAYNVGENRTPQRISKNGIDGSNTVTSGTRAVDGSVISAVCKSTPPCTPTFVLWNNIIGNIRKTTTPKLRETN